MVCTKKKKTECTLQVELAFYNLGERPFRYEELVILSQDMSRHQGSLWSLGIILERNNMSFLNHEPRSTQIDRSNFSDMQRKGLKKLDKCMNIGGYISTVGISITGQG